MPSLSQLLFDQFNPAIAELNPAVPTQIGDAWSWQEPDPNVSTTAAPAENGQTQMQASFGPDGTPSLTGWAGGAFPAGNSQAPGQGAGGGDDSSMWWDKQAPWWDQGLTFVKERQRFGAPFAYPDININMQQSQSQMQWMEPGQCPEHPDAPPHECPGTPPPPPPTDDTPPPPPTDDTPPPPPGRDWPPPPRDWPRPDGEFDPGPITLPVPEGEFPPGSFTAPGGGGGGGGTVTGSGTPATGVPGSGTGPPGWVGPKVPPRRVNPVIPGLPQFNFPGGRNPNNFWGLPLWNQSGGGLGPGPSNPGTSGGLPTPAPGGGAMPTVPGAPGMGAAGGGASMGRLPVTPEEQAAIDDFWRAASMGGPGSKFSAVPGGVSPEEQAAIDQFFVNASQGGPGSVPPTPPGWSDEQWRAEVATNPERAKQISEHWNGINAQAAAQQPRQIYDPGRTRVTGGSLVETILGEGDKTVDRKKGYYPPGGGQAPPPPAAPWSSDQERNAFLAAGGSDIYNPDGSLTELGKQRQATGTLEAAVNATRAGAGLPPVDLNSDGINDSFRGGAPPAAQTMGVAQSTGPWANDQEREAFLAAGGSEVYNPDGSLTTTGQIAQGSGWLEQKVNAIRNVAGLPPVDVDGDGEIHGGPYTSQPAAASGQALTNSGWDPLAKLGSQAPERAGKFDATAPGWTGPKGSAARTQFDPNVPAAFQNSSPIAGLATQNSNLGRGSTPYSRSAGLLDTNAPGASQNPNAPTGAGGGGGSSGSGYTPPTTDTSLSRTLGALRGMQPGSNTFSTTIVNQGPSGIQNEFPRQSAPRSPTPGAPRPATPAAPRPATPAAPRPATPTPPRPTATPPRPPTPPPRPTTTYTPPRSTSVSTPYRPTPAAFSGYTPAPAYKAPTTSYKPPTSSYTPPRSSSVSTSYSAPKPVTKVTTPKVTATTIKTPVKVTAKPLPKVTTPKVTATTIKKPVKLSTGVSSIKSFGAKLI